ncbi:MAG: hypothetical protein U1A25_02730 [Candidatus Sungbacteria bacterium]|nr:hypothetical protein [Candidatus Sungbacteria bacterium]
MDEQGQVRHPSREPHADVPPRLMYEAAFTARNAEGSILDSNTRYFYLGQAALVGYMIFEFKSWQQGSLHSLFLVLILMVCCFALSLHTVYSETRMNSSFRLMGICENTCEYYEKHAYIDPALYFYASMSVREPTESRASVSFQTDLIIFLAEMWFFLGWV